MCYEACLALFERNVAVNQVTVANELARQADGNDRDLLTIVGGAEYLSALVSNVPTSVHIEHYAEIVPPHLGSQGGHSRRRPHCGPGTRGRAG